MNEVAGQGNQAVVVIARGALPHRHLADVRAQRALGPGARPRVLDQKDTHRVAKAGYRVMDGLGVGRQLTAVEIDLVDKAAQVPRLIDGRPIVGYRMALDAGRRSLDLIEAHAPVDDDIGPLAPVGQLKQILNIYGFPRCH